MKKVLGFMVMLLSVVFLAACSSQENLDGEWYRYDKSDNYLSSVADITIDGTSGSQYDAGNFTVDTERKEFSVNGFVVKYVYKDGVLSLDGKTYVKKGTSAYDEAKKETESSSSN